MRVAMILAYPGIPWQEDWCRVGRYAADLVEVAPVVRLSLPPEPGLSGVGRDPAKPRRWEVVQPRWRPSRLLGPVARHATGRRVRSVLQRAAIEGGAFDVLHAHSYYTADVLLPWLKRSGLPYLVTEHDPGWYDHPSRRRPGGRRLELTREYFNDASIVTPVCDSLHRALVDAGVHANYEVLRNPVDVALLPPPRINPRIDPNRVRLLAAGRFAPQKGFDILLDALMEARRYDSRLTLQLAGEGSLRQELVEQIESQDLGHVVTLPGHQNRPALLGLMADADLFVLSSHAENYPMVVAEALCMGTPVIGTDTGAVAELVGPNDGQVVPPGDAVSLARALAETANSLDSFDRAEIANRARQTHNLPAIGDRLAELYRQVAMNGDEMPQS